MSENKRRREVKELDSSNSWIGRYWLSAMDRRSQLDFATYFYHYDGRSWRYDTYITYKEYAHRITIIIVSAAVFGTGVGQLITEFFIK